MFFHAGYCFHIALLIENEWNDTVLNDWSTSATCEAKHGSNLLNALSDKYCLLCIRKRNKSFILDF